MDKKKIVALVLVLAAGGVLSYALLPGYFGGDEKPAAPRDEIAKLKAQPPKKPAATLPSPPPETAEARKDKDTGSGNTAGPAPSQPVGKEPQEARALLPSAPPAWAGEERRLHAMLRDRDLKLVDHEYKRTLRKIEREEIEDEAALEKAHTEAEKARAERAYARANPSQFAPKSQGPGMGGPVGGGLPPVMPMASGPGVSAPRATAMEGYDQPVLRMISTVGNEKVAFLEHRGSLYRVKAGDSLATWKVKTVGDDSVQIVSGRDVKTLPFALPADDSAHSGALPPPPGVPGVPRPGNT